MVASSPSDQFAPPNNHSLEAAFATSRVNITSSDDPGASVVKAGVRYPSVPSSLNNRLPLSVTALSVVFVRVIDKSQVRKHSADTKLSSLKVTSTVLARDKSSRPAPMLKLSACVRPSSFSTSRIEEVTKALFICCALHSGCICFSNAAAPATWGDAMEVPFLNEKFSPI